MNGKVTTVPFSLWTCDSPSSSCSIFDGIGRQLSLWKRLFVKWKQICDTSVTTMEDFPSACMTTKPSNISVRSTLVVVIFFWNIITVFCECVFYENCYLFAKTLCTPCYWSSLAVTALFTLFVRQRENMVSKRFFKLKCLIFKFSLSCFILIILFESKNTLWFYRFDVNVNILTMSGTYRLTPPTFSK